VLDQVERHQLKHDMVPDAAKIQRIEGSIYNMMHYRRRRSNVFGDARF